MRTLESRRKTSESLKRFWAAHPEEALARGSKVAGERNYRWKGGVSRLNKSIRLMAETRRWMEAVKSRDGACVRCGSEEGLESHHIRPLADIVTELGITSRDDAKKHAIALWDVSNGETLCAKCHYAEHGRTGAPSSRQTVFKTCLECGDAFAVRPSMAAKRECCGRYCADALKAKRHAGAGNPNWKGGRVAKSCARCNQPFYLKPSVAALGLGKYCSRECKYAAG